MAVGNLHSTILDLNEALQIGKIIADRIYIPLF